MNNYLLIIIADILLAFDFILQKQYQKKAGTDTYAGLLFNTLLGFFTAIVFWCINGFKIEFSIYSLVMALSMSTLCFLYVMLGLKIMRSGNISFYTLFLMTGGMVVPYIWGVFFLNEQLTFLRIIGILLIILSIVLSNLSNTKADKRLFVLCILVFFLNGFASVISKMHQVNIIYKSINTTEFVFWTGMIKFILCGIAFLILRSKDTADKRIEIKEVRRIIFLSAIVSGIAYMFQLIGAENVPATVLYPLITGGTIVLSSLLECVIYKEKLSAAQWKCIGICFVGTCLFL